MKRFLTVNITAEVEVDDESDLYPSVSTMLYMLADENSRQEGPLTLEVEQGSFKAKMSAHDEVGT